MSLPLEVSLFWDNQQLTRLEQLTLASYYINFDKINIFTYNKELFRGWMDRCKINIYDAGDVMPKDERFYYKGNGDCVKYSVVGFSDIIRYKIVYNTGGWYSDFDVTCLKPYNFTENHTVIRYHPVHKSISNICKFQKNDEILTELHDTTKRLINECNNIWTAPLTIFSDIISKYGYDDYVVAGVLGEDDYDKSIKPLLTKNLRSIDISNQYAIHWCRSAITTGNWSVDHICDINNPFPGTYLSFLYTKHGV